MSLSEMGSAPTRRKKPIKTIPLRGTIEINGKVPGKALAPAVDVAVAPAPTTGRKIPQWVWLLAATAGLAAVFYYMRLGKRRGRRRRNPLGWPR